jgi:hypothetical protein
VIPSSDIGLTHAASIVLLDSARYPLNDQLRESCEAIACLPGPQLATVAYDQGRGTPIRLCPTHARVVASAWDLKLPAGWDGEV